MSIKMNGNADKKGNKKPLVPIDSKKLVFLENFIQENIEILNDDSHINNKKERAPSFQCKFCLKTFACSPSVSRHKKVCPLNENAKKNKPLVCHLCNNTFSRTDGLKVHMKRCSTTSMKKYKNCLYQNCDVKFYHKQALMQHLTNSHGQVFQKEVQKVFPNEQAFYSWKEKTEESTFSYFSKKNGKKANIQYFYCQQDGESKGAKRKTNRKNAKGQIRTGKTCIASMKVMKLSNSGVVVKFQPMHCHVLKPEDLKHHPLSKNTYESINEQLAMGLSPKQIMKSLEGKSNCETDLKELQASRKNDFVTVHRIQGIARLRRVKLRADPDDSISLTKIVKKFMEESSNPIILYKPLKEEKIIGPEEMQDLYNSPDLFLLGIQTHEQQKVFKEKAPEVLSINIVHGTNKYDYQLLSVVAPDEYHRGYPVAHFISNKMDENTISCFLLALKNNNPDVVINCMITNDDPVITEAIQVVFNDEIHHLFCLSYMHHIFEHYLKNFAPVEPREEMYSLLNVLISSATEEWFMSVFDSFISSFKEIAPQFVDLFENYRKTAHKWGVCFRNFPHGDIDTILLNETFHNRLKATCAKKKANWRLDDLTTLLLEIEQDDYESRLKEKVLGVPFGLNDSSNYRHERGLQISNKDVIEQFPNNWIVLSQTSKEKRYYVSKCVDVCKYETCPYICSNILCYKLCVHLYFCTCTDKSPICKHIHKVHSLLTKIISIPADELTNGDYNMRDDETVTFYEGDVIEAEAIIDGSQVFQPNVEQMFVSNPIVNAESSLEPIVEVNVADGGLGEFQEEITLVVGEYNDENLIEENLEEEGQVMIEGDFEEEGGTIIEEDMEEDETLIEEVIITGSGDELEVECDSHSVDDVKLKINQHLDVLSNIIHESDISESVLDTVHLSLKNLLNIVQIQET